MESKVKLNIPRSVQDQNYRYQMPAIQISLQGSGGGVKSKFENIKDVAHALVVPLDYPLKYIGKEIGSQTEIKGDAYLISGSHTAEKLQQILDKFIEKYILCPKCRLPEMRIFIGNQDFIEQDIDIPLPIDSTLEITYSENQMIGAVFSDDDDFSCFFTLLKDIQKIFINTCYVEDVGIDAGVLVNGRDAGHDLDGCLAVGGLVEIVDRHGRHHRAVLHIFVYGGW